MPTDFGERDGGLRSPATSRQGHASPACAPPRRARSDGVAGRSIERCIENHELEIKSMNTDAKK
ncbi:MAG: hypothetical protein WKF75_04930, partial [Singulisphaera sp.]